MGLGACGSSLNSSRRTVSPSHKTPGSAGLPQKPGTLPLTEKCGFMEEEFFLTLQSLRSSEAPSAQMVGGHLRKSLLRSPSCTMDWDGLEPQLQCGLGRSGTSSAQAETQGFLLVCHCSQES